MNRKEAKLAKLPRYTGKVCEKHPKLNGERKTPSGVCCGCHIEAVNGWKQSNPERVAENKRNWAKANPESRLASKTKWRNANKEHQAKLVAAWARANPDKIVAKVNRRRAAKLQAVPGWFEKEKVELVYQKADELGFQTDHIVPLIHPLVCGLHCWYNLQLLDQPLNGSKGNRHWPDMP